MPYESIDPLKLRVWPLAERVSTLRVQDVSADALDQPEAAGELGRQIGRLAERVRAACDVGAAVMLTYGAHLVKNGGAALINRLIDGGWVTHLATQGAGVIHDWEFAHAGVSSELVRENAPVGRFGSWDETGRSICLAVLAGSADGLGFGEAVGRFISEDGVTLPSPDELRSKIAAAPDDPLAGARADLLRAMLEHELAGGRIETKHPQKQHCILARAFDAHVPVTVHPGIGYDIFVNHPMFSGAAVGRAGGVDARVFAASVDRLEGGVYLSVGSAIMSPQVFEKAFSAANNLRQQAGRGFIRDHYLAIVDIQDGGGWDWSAGEPPKDNPAYYLRFCKSFHRMGGTLDYLCADNCLVLANLLRRLEG